MTPSARSVALSRYYGGSVVGLRVIFGLTRKMNLYWGQSSVSLSKSCSFAFNSSTGTTSSLLPRTQSLVDVCGPDQSAPSSSMEAP